MAILTFTVSVEVDDRLVDHPTPEESSEIAGILAEMEEIVSKKGYDLDDSSAEIEA